jgi:hypothetical protein
VALPTPWLRHLRLLLLLIVVDCCGWLHVVAANAETGKQL